MSVKPIFVPIKSIEHGEEHVYFGWNYFVTNQSPIAILIMEQLIIPKMQNIIKCVKEYENIGDMYGYEEGQFELSELAENPYATHIALQFPIYLMYSGLIRNPSRLSVNYLCNESKSPQLRRIIKSYYERKLTNVLYEDYLYRIKDAELRKIIPLEKKESALNNNAEFNYYLQKSLSIIESDYAIELLKEYPRHIDIHLLCENSSMGAYELIKEYIKNVRETDDYAIQLLCESGSKFAYKLLKKHMKNIYELNDDDYYVIWKKIASLNTNPYTLKLLEEYYVSVDAIPENIWRCLSQNPAALYLLEQCPNSDYIDWNEVSRNPGMIPLIEKNMDKIDWQYLSENENAMDILERNKDKIFYDRLCINKNPRAACLFTQSFEETNENGCLDEYIYSSENTLHLMFTLNYKEMKKANEEFAKELTQVVFAPERIAQMAERYKMAMWQVMEMYE